MLSCGDCWSGCLLELELELLELEGGGGGSVGDEGDDHRSSELTSVPELPGHVEKYLRLLEEDSSGSVVSTLSETLSQLRAAGSAPSTSSLKF